jgi:aryl-alcohol dehydrogenase-like predicted oxidoreductase
MERQMTETVVLGKTDIRLSPLGLGAWQWGDRLIWKAGPAYTETDIRAGFDAALQAGINWVDTAEVYGPWTSERILGRFLRAAPVMVATKCFPYPWRFSAGALRGALQASLKRLGLPRVDLYQMHWPAPVVKVEDWMDAMASVARAGLTRAIGVSNYSAEQTRRAADRLSKYNLPLASNQIEYSLLQREPERNGVLAACRELGVTVIAYSPIAKGVLSGKYTPEHVPPGVRGRQYNRAYLSRIQPLIGLIKEIGSAHGGRTPTQVALNWLICQGTLPIPGAKTLRQAQDNAGALGWRLTQAEIQALNAASDRMM